MLAKKLDRPATLADLESLPPTVKGEIIEGTLYTQARPRPGHGFAGSVLGGQLSGAFNSGNSDTSGWWILDEPGIELPGSPEIAPDIAGWRRERLPNISPDKAITLAPDWVCEILSPSNRSYDRAVKFPFYARVCVPYLWIIDPEAHTLEVRALIKERWTELAVFADEALVRAEPFAELEIPLGRLWLKSP